MRKLRLRSVLVAIITLVMKHVTELFAQQRLRLGAASLGTAYSTTQHACTAVLPLQLFQSMTNSKSYGLT